MYNLNLKKKEGYIVLQPWPSKGIPQPTTSISPRNLLEMKIMDVYHRGTTLENGSGTQTLS